ncbi:Ketosteroid isomerase homolog [hydrothermal vent metagenome]|uniref:Ketosteroid isomerase homolog n=1 Tax=hydrothermal vent metagenome TaxID=652676 RepID=A0A3B0Z267_9ZZZZ
MKLLLTLLTCCLLSTGLARADSSKQQIENLISRYETALNGNDLNGVLGVYGKKPIFMPQHAPAQIGRDAVRQAYANVFNTIKLDIKFTIHEIEVLGDTAWARTSSAGKTKILADNVVVNEGNNEIFIFKNEDNNWKIHQYLFSTNQPRQ